MANTVACDKTSSTTAETGMPAAVMRRISSSFGKPMRDMRSNSGPDVFGKTATHATKRL